MARRQAGAASVAAALLLLACAGLPRLVERHLLAASIELSFDRPADLIPPERIHVNSTADRQIALAWDPILVGAVAGYAVLRAPRAEGPYSLLGRTGSRFETIYIDAGSSPGSLGDGQTYFYRVHPFDAEGRVSRSHTFVAATTDPAPDAPRGLHAYSNLPRRVVLRWDPSAREDVAAYAVLRSPTVAGPWEQVSVVEGRLRAVHEDRVPGDLRVMYYRLRALNRFGGESEMTEPVRAVTKAHPLPPLGLEVAARTLGSLRLRWAPNVERDLLRYELWRTVQEGDAWAEQRRIGEVEPPATEFVDADVACGARVRYRARAVDRDGLVSSFSGPLEVEGADAGLAVKGTGDALELRWAAEAARAWPRARIFERRTLRPDRLLGEVNAASRFPLPALSSGSHHLTLELSEPEVAAPAPGRVPLPQGRRASGDLRQAPACSVRVEVP
jgi:fibronectin type 3 domain-containing protein